MTYCTGGTVTEDSTYRTHTFTSSDTLVVEEPGPIEYCVVAGGGGGGGSGSSGAGGGGGGGGVAIGSVFVAVDETITVGSGGQRGTDFQVSGDPGGNSSIGSLATANGGGGGGSSGEQNGDSGGSGGGAGANNSSGGSGGSGTALEGESGGGGDANDGGGGGGASQAGQTGSGGSGADGGDGVEWPAGSGDYYGGGGGGASTSGQGSGGLGGGGNASAGSTQQKGSPNTGGGGGGLHDSSGTGSDGGSGIVIVRYKIAEYTYDQIVRRDNPKLYLPLSDVAAGRDRASNMVGGDGTYNGSPTLGVAGPGPVGSTAVMFDASTEYVSASTVDVNSDFTMEMWAYVDTHSDHRILASQNDGSSVYWIWIWRTDARQWSFQYNLGPGSLYIESGADLATGVWQHCVLTRSGSTWTFYLDGESVGTDTSSETGMADTANVHVAAYSSFTLDGDAAAFAVYDYALTTDQIAQHYAAAPPAFRGFPEAQAEADGAVLHLPLDDVGGTVAYAGVGSNGSYSGGPTLRVTGPSDVIPYGISTDGTDDYVDTGTGTLDQSDAGQTIEFWLNLASELNSSSSRRDLYAASSGSDNRICFGAFTGGFSGETFGIYNDKGSPTGHSGWTDVVAAGWHHWVFVYAGSQNAWTAYIDGESKGSPDLNFNGGSKGLHTNTTSWDLARNQATDHYAFDGIAAFTVYDRELTAAEVYERYTLGLDLRNPHANGPVSY